MFYVVQEKWNSVLFVHSLDDGPTEDSRYPLLANSKLWRTIAGGLKDPVEEAHLKYNIPFSFSRNVLFIRAYTNGLTAVLSRISVWITEYVSLLVLRDV